MRFVILDRYFAYLAALNLLVCGYLFFADSALIALAIIAANLGIVALKQKSQSYLDKDISLDHLAALAPKISNNITITDTHNNQLSTNAYNTEIIEVTNLNEVFSDLGDDTKRIIKSRSDLGTRHYLDSREELRDAEGKIRGFVHIYTDVSAVIEHWQSLLYKTKKYEIRASPAAKSTDERGIMDNSVDGVLVFAYDEEQKCALNLLDFNYAMRDVVADSRLSINDIFHESQKERVEAIFRNYVEEKPVLFEALMLRKNKPFPAEIHASLCKFNGKSALFLNIRDITQRKEEYLARDKNRLLAIKDDKMRLVVYVLNILIIKLNPAFSAINKQTAHILEAYPPLKRETSDIAAAKASIESTIKDLTAFYSPSASKAHCSVKSLLEEICQSIFFKEVLGKTQINITQKGALEDIYCDEGALKFVLITIINNALECINAKANLEGKIDIALREGGNFVLISIEDNAGGIDQAALSRIFDLFYTDKNNHAGLGLTTCKVLVENVLFGSISATNVSDGKHSGVRFDLQIAKQ